MRIGTLALALLAPITAFAAPVPKNDSAKALPAEGATAPRIVVLRPSDDGKVKITAMKTEKRAVQVMIAIAPGNPGGAAPVAKEFTVRVPAVVDLSEVKDLKVYNTAGKEVPKDDALKMLAKGGVVIVSCDGKPVDRGYLATFREGTLVLVAADLVEMNTTKITMPLVAFPGGNAAGPPAIPVPAPLPAPRK
jgi:hypothetical protein